MEEIFARKKYMHGGEIHMEEVNMKGRCIVGRYKYKRVLPREIYTWRGSVPRGDLLVEGRTEHTEYNIHNYRRDIPQRRCIRKGPYTPD